MAGLSPSSSRGDSVRPRWGDDDDDLPLSQRSPLWGSFGSLGYGAGGAGTPTWCTYASAPCATPPVHRAAAASPPRFPRYVPALEECPGCEHYSRSVATCSEDCCDTAACVTCRAECGWTSCDACAEAYCSRHLHPVTFDTRECCGLHLLTADPYYLCRFCASHLAQLLPREENREDEQAHGVAACGNCGRSTCHHALFCRNCSVQTVEQAAMEEARHVTPAPRLPRHWLEQLSGLENRCLALDILQFYTYCYEPLMVQAPVSRRVGGRRTATKHARPYVPPP